MYMCIYFCIDMYMYTHIYMCILILNPQPYADVISSSDGLLLITKGCISAFWSNCLLLNPQSSTLNPAQIFLRT